MFLLTIPAPNVKSPQVNTMLFAYHKMRDQVERPEDKLYVDCYLAIATMPFEDPQRWMDVYRKAQPLIRNIFHKSKVKSERSGTGKILTTGIHPDILDLTVVVLDLLDSQPDDPYYPQNKAIKALRLSANHGKDLVKMAEVLGVAENESRPVLKRVL